MNIGVDIMGGDFVHDFILQGAIIVCKQINDEVTLVLIGTTDVFIGFFKIMVKIFPVLKLQNSRCN
ncbi:MAG: hypothetical protein COX07_02920 [Bacteroidetes bacterium CG23_combo_of_CG06-09_8_20_14_all_32_9]|nr:MAG: hypothetical protein COX07_02920 [Bacteroidetes bacterium CG23_combo_of_CG06-09_8_20_14_all_32_9]